MIGFQLSRLYSTCDLYISHVCPYAFKCVIYSISSMVRTEHFMIETGILISIVCLSTCTWLWCIRCLMHVWQCIWLLRRHWYFRGHFVLIIANCAAFSGACRWQATHEWNLLPNFRWPLPFFYATTHFWCNGEISEAVIEPYTFSAPFFLFCYSVSVAEVTAHTCPPLHGIHFASETSMKGTVVHLTYCGENNCSSCWSLHLSDLYVATAGPMLVACSLILLGKQNKKGRRAPYHVPTSALLLHSFSV